MPGFLTSLLTDYREGVERQRNRPFLRASMAACALVAAADGEVSFGERIRVDQILDTLERLKVFDPHEGVDVFNEFTAAILAAPRRGREDALEAVRAVTADPDTAALLVRMCLAIAESGGEKPLATQIEIVMLCSLIGVDPHNLGLYIDDPEDGLAEPRA